MLSTGVITGPSVGARGLNCFKDSKKLFSSGFCPCSARSLSRGKTICVSLSTALFDQVTCLKFYKKKKKKKKKKKCHYRRYEGMSKKECQKFIVRQYQKTTLQPSPEERRYGLLDCFGAYRVQTKIVKWGGGYFHCLLYTSIVLILRSIEFCRNMLPCSPRGMTSTR